MANHLVQRRKLGKNKGEGTRDQFKQLAGLRERRGGPREGFCVFVVVFSGHRNSIEFPCGENLFSGNENKFLFSVSIRIGETSLLRQKQKFVSVFVVDKNRPKEFAFCDYTEVLKSSL